MNACKSDRQLLKRMLEEEQDAYNYNINNCNWIKKEKKDLTRKGKGRHIKVNQLKTKREKVLKE